MGAKKEKIARERKDAWIGDAVLALFARQWILRNESQFDQSREELFRSMTSNRFLSAFGNPTSVEATIGTLYQEEGYAGAVAWIENNLLPLFKKQINNRQKHRP
jgi:dsRNA-specific ribonuclease